jgi:hypothetical protein
MAAARNKKLETDALRALRARTQYGEILDDGTYSFPTLYSATPTGRHKYWQIWLELYRHDKKIKITYQHFTHNLNDEYAAAIYTEYGTIDSENYRRTEPKWGTRKNVGRSNETNVLMDVAIIANKKFSDNLKKYSLSTDDVESDNMDFKGFYHPVRYHDYKKYRNRYNDGDVIYAQPKMNGQNITITRLDIADTRNIDHFDLDTAKGSAAPFAAEIQKEIRSSKAGTPVLKTVAYTRQLHVEYGHTNILDKLTPVLTEFPDLYLCGEYYEHGESLQNIMSMSKTPDARIHLYLFDCFFSNNRDMTFEDRWRFMSTNRTLAAALVNSDILLAPTHVLHSHTEITNLFNDYISQRYEGVVLKFPNGTYKTNIKTSHRVATILKYKAEEDGEFVIIGHMLGNGSHADMIVWRLQTEDGREFTCMMNGTHEFVRDLTRKVEAHPENYYGKYMRVHYFELSDDGIPLQPHAVTIMDKTEV